AIIGWARLSAQAWEGSGYNLNASELARGLAMRGHRVRYLQSGMAFSWGITGPGRPRIRLRERWGPGTTRDAQAPSHAAQGGIPCFEVVNSPNLSPAAWNFGNLTSEIADADTTRLVVDWAKGEIDGLPSDERRPADVVHIHSQEGLALDLIPTLRRAGFPVVVTLHNYWYLCPQVDLLYGERSVCTDYDGGRRCESCLKRSDVANLRRAKAAGDTLEGLLGLYAADVVRKAAYGTAARIKELLGKDPEGRAKRAEAKSRLTRPPHPDAHPDPALLDGWEATPRAVDASAHASLEEWERPRDYERAPRDANERVLAGGLYDHPSAPGPSASGTPNGTTHAAQVQSSTVHLRVLNDFGKRRLAGVEALKSASLVTSPSDYLRRVHVAMGVPEERTRHILLGQPHFDQIHRAAARSPYYRVRPWSPEMADRTPLRFGFLGTTRPNKGLEVLTRAIPLIPTDVRQRIRITIHAAGIDSGFRKRLSIYPEVSVFGGYDTTQLVSMLAPGGTGGGAGGYDVAILPHIWLENSPLVLLENLHAGKFVICSRLGGPVDWIVEPDASRTESPLGNGLLFPGGRPDELAACITRMVKGEVLVPSPREVHASSVLRSYPDHVNEWQGIYEEVLKGVPKRSVTPIHAAG
ncbi:MAG: glycosyltransferase, partial [Phycisphaeraceae bacterium]|nr:glycosyltransferase [Phycisphaeraceae bacterium]